MKNSLCIHVNSAERLYDDGLISAEVYKDIMSKIAEEKVKEQEVKKNG